jgi:hypothetical protein
MSYETLKCMDINQSEVISLAWTINSLLYVLYRSVGN